jgi:protein-S-isoprenylcysteine O-methyltransferase Ste14
MRPSFEFLPLNARKIIYTVYVCAFVIAIGIDAYFGNTDPPWVEAINRVILATGGFAVAIARMNAHSPAESSERYPDHKPENELVEPEEEQG